jgi:hypothetical protein
MSDNDPHITFVSHVGPVTIKQWFSEKDKYWNIAGECSECHQWPCKHVGPDLKKPTIANKKKAE